MTTIDIVSPFDGDNSSSKAEFDKIEKMSEKERQEYLQNVSDEIKRLETRYVKQYGQEDWDKLQRFIKTNLEERLAARDTE